MLRKVGIALIPVLLVSCCSLRPRDTDTDGTPTTSISVASFNLQVFGHTKASDAEVMGILAEIIRSHTIVAIQEIRDATGTAIVALKDKVNEGGRQYDMVIGPRLGRSTSKEQYAFFYDTDVIELLPGAYTFDDDGDGNDSNDIDDSLHPGDLFEREPFITPFKVKLGTFDFVLVNIHTKPDDATTEIGHLPQVIADVPPHLGESDIVCLGDFNADGSYFDEDGYASIFPASQYNWLIPNSEDTTVAASENTYDRIVTTLSASEDFAGSYGVGRFDQQYDFGSLSIAPSDVSDHYPVWAQFHTDLDTD